MIKEFFIKRLVKKWQNYLGLQGFKIYIIKEKQEVLNGSWEKDKRAKLWKNYRVQADNYYDIPRKVAIIRLNKDLKIKELEENILHELLHMKFEKDEEWAITKLTNYLLKDK
jgi:hypothetical protein